MLLLKIEGAQLHDWGNDDIIQIILYHSSATTQQQPMVRILVPMETETKCLFTGGHEWFLNETEETLIAVMLQFPDYLHCVLNNLRK